MHSNTRVDHIQTADRNSLAEIMPSCAKMSNRRCLWLSSGSMYIVRVWVIVSAMCIANSGSGSSSSRFIERIRLRGDMIEVFKIVHNVYNNRVAASLSYYNMYVTRGNKFKLHNQSFNHNFRKNFFSAKKQ